MENTTYLQSQETTKKPRATFILIYIAYIVCFLDRSAINIALSYIGKDFHLSTTTLGVVASAFFFSYSLMQIPGGWLTDKFGTRNTVIVAITMWSIFTVFTGFAWSLASLIVIRILFGLGEGAFPSASLKQVAEEFSYNSRSQATSAMISSNYVGAAIAPVIIAPIIATAGWRGAFHLLGIVGIVFVIVYFFVMKPKQVAKQKAAGIKRNKIKWSEVLTNKLIWQFFIVVFGLSSVTKGLDSWMPTYLLQARHINLAGVAWMVPLPSLAAGVGALTSGFIMIKWFDGKEKWLIALTSLLATIFMFGMYKSTSVGAVITFEVFTYLFKSVAFSSSFAFFAKLMTKGAYGSSIGIVNFGGQLSGFIAPILIGYLVQVFGGSYSAAFLYLVAAAAVAFIAALTFNEKKIAEYKNNVISSQESED